MEAGDQVLLSAWEAKVCYWHITRIIHSWLCSFYIDVQIVSLALQSSGSQMPVKANTELCEIELEPSHESMVVRQEYRCWFLRSIPPSAYRATFI